MDDCFLETEQRRPSHEALIAAYGGALLTSSFSCSVTSVASWKMSWRNIIMPCSEHETMSNCTFATTNCSCNAAGCWQVLVKHQGRYTHHHPLWPQSVKRALVSLGALQDPVGLPFPGSLFHLGHWPATRGGFLRTRQICRDADRQDTALVMRHHPGA